MLSILPYGDASKELEHPKSVHNYDYVSRSEFILEGGYGEEYEYVIEYLDAPFPVREIRTDPEDIYRVGFRPTGVEEAVGETGEFEVEVFSFSHVDKVLVRVYIYEQIDCLDSVLHGSGNTSGYEQIYEMDEVDVYESEKHLPQLSKMVEYAERDLVEGVGGFSRDEVEGVKLVDLDRSHSTVVVPSVVRDASVPEGLDTRVPIVRGLLLYLEGEKQQVSFQELVREAGSVFGVRDETAEKYVRKLVDWCEDIEVEKGFINIE